MSGYQHYVENPYVLNFIALWSMTFSLTGLLCRVFSIDTYLGLRVIHLVYVVLMQTAVYLYLRRYLKTRYIIAGLVLATLAHFGSYTEMNYNDYSAGLFMLSVMSFHHGITVDKRRYVLIAGALAGAAFFFRVVNVTLIVLPLLSCIVSCRWQSAMGRGARVAWFAVGYVAGAALMVGAMAVDGTLGAFAQTVGDLFSISSEGRSPHGFITVIMSVLMLYKGEVAGFSVVLVVALLMFCAFLKLKGIVRFAMLAVLSVSVVACIYFGESPANITVGLCLLALALVCVGNRHRADFASLYVLSMIVPMVMPIGSNAGPDFYGKDVCFLSLPMAVAVVAEWPMSSSYTQSCRRAMLLAFASICVAMLYTNVKRPQMEEGNRLQCLYRVNSPLTGPILTTKENADMHNNLISELQPIVPRGSYMICTFSQTAVSLLGCKMWAIIHTEFSSDRMNARYIAVAYRHSGELPYLLLRKSTITDHERYVLQCLESIRPYGKVWESGDFVLLKDVSGDRLQKG